MPKLKITNHGIHTTSVGDPHGTFYMTVPAKESLTKEVSVESLENMRGQLEALSNRLFKDNSGPVVEIEIIQERSDASLTYEPATADVTRYLGNRVVYGAFAGAPKTASTVSKRAYSLTAGEAYVDGLHTIIAAAENAVADDEIDARGADVSKEKLSKDKSRYAHLCLVKKDDAVKQVLVFGEEAEKGKASKVSDADIASAVGVYLVENVAVHAFVRVADILFDVAGDVLQEVVNHRPVPASYR